MDAEGWDERYAASELVWSAGPNQFVLQECADLPPGRAVDLAAGEGRNAIWLARRGWHVTAVDFSRVALDKGARLAGDTAVEWVVGDATQWRSEEPVDLAVVAYLQLPAAERRAANRNAVESLRPGGTFLLVAHDSTNLAEGTGGPQDPTVLMTAEDVLADLVVSRGSRWTWCGPAGWRARWSSATTTAARRPRPRGTAWSASPAAERQPRPHRSTAVCSRWSLTRVSRAR